MQSKEISKAETIQTVQRVADIYRSIQNKINNDLVVSYIWHTNTLEGSHFQKWAVRKVLKGLEDKRFKPKDVAMVQSQKRALKFVRAMSLIRDYSIAEADVKHLHSIVAESNPGEYRTNDLEGDVVCHSEISEHMRALLSFINNKKVFYKFRPVEQAALVHYQFSKIRPFQESENVARLLMNYVLLRDGYPLTVLKSYDKEEYQSSLAKEDPIYFLQYITKCTLSAVNTHRIGTRDFLKPINLYGLISRGQI